MKKKVIVGMSGGIDSSVAAYILKEKGYEVIGVTLKLYPEVSKCCRPEDIEDAKKVASKIGIPHLLLDFTKEFKKAVIDYFAKEYLRGRTPNPCAVCNRDIKFRLLIEKAKEIGADFVSTGHYAKIVKRGSEYFLSPAKDRNKSQEYFLSLILPSHLRFLLFPLGDLYKSEVVELARKVKLPVRTKPESQDVCFIGNSSYVEFLKKNYDIELKKGEIMDIKGNVLGFHENFIKYTLGQRRGLGISHSEPLYVVKIDYKKNRIVVGKREHTFFKTIYVTPLVWRGKRQGTYWVKIRYRHKKSKAEVSLDSKDEKIKVEFYEPQFAPTPGQVAVFYDNDELVIGSGFIDKLEYNF